jgi:hypothetical protein
MVSQGRTRLRHSPQGNTNTTTTTQRQDDNNDTRQQHHHHKATTTTPSPPPHSTRQPDTTTTPRRLHSGSSSSSATTTEEEEAEEWAAAAAAAAVVVEKVEGEGEGEEEERHTVLAEHVPLCFQQQLAARGTLRDVVGVEENYRLLELLYQFTGEVPPASAREPSGRTSAALIHKYIYICISIYTRHRRQ